MSNFKTAVTQSIRPALSLLVILTVLTGLAYPALITGISQALWADKANGSLIHKQDKAIGSSLIGQSFTDPAYLWGRPSATATTPYNGQASGGSNLGPLNPDLAKAIQDRIAVLQKADPSNSAIVPIDLVTASGSGLDPEISPAAAEYQVARIARLRGLTAAQVQAVITQHTQGPQAGLFGETRVNVLLVNLALDQLAPATKTVAVTTAHS
jgi:K+-transporting ATPase ATPase C chain